MKKKGGLVCAPEKRNDLVKTWLTSWSLKKKKKGANFHTRLGYNYAAAAPAKRSRQACDHGGLEILDDAHVTYFFVPSEEGQALRLSRSHDKPRRIDAPFNPICSDPTFVPAKGYIDVDIIGRRIVGEKLSFSLWDVWLASWDYICKETASSAPILNAENTPDTRPRLEPRTRLIRHVLEEPSDSWSHGFRGHAMGNS